MDPIYDDLPESRRPTSAHIAWAAGLIGAGSTLVGSELHNPGMVYVGAAVSALALVGLWPSRRASRFGAVVSEYPLHVDTSREDASRWRQHHEIVAHFEREQARAEERDPKASKLLAGFVSLDPGYNALIERLDETAGLSLDAILLLGPSGSGKTELARRIHELRKAAGLLTGEFVEVNCADFASDENMVALTGHTAHAFTGAGQYREGLITRARGGTLFFDEVGDLSPRQQGALLRLMNSKQYYRMGSDELETTDATFVFATLRDLRAMGQTGAFRADLRSRIDMLTYVLPSLGERSVDLPGLFDLFVALNEGARGHAITVVPAAREAFLSYAQAHPEVWFDNLRGYGKSVGRMSLNRRRAIDVQDVEREIVLLEEVHAPLLGRGDGGPLDLGRIQDMISVEAEADRLGKYRVQDTRQLHYLRHHLQCRSHSAKRSVSAANREIRSPLLCGGVAVSASAR